VAHRGAIAAGLVVGGVAVYAALTVTSLRTQSATFDEGTNLPSGYTSLKLGDYRLSPEHPPLVKVLAATPLLFMDVTVKEDDESWALRRQWGFGKRFLYRWNDADRLLFRARLPIVALGALLGVSVFLWARSRYGLSSAALALFLCVLSPDVLAHGQIVTTDVGIALFMFLAVVAFDAACRRVSPGRIALAGLAAGAALATKFSAVLLLPILGSLALVAVLAPEPMSLALPGRPPRAVSGRRARAAVVAAVLAAIGLSSLAVVWASYGFRSRLSPDPEVEASFEWSRVEPDGALEKPVARLVRASGVLPEAFVFGFLRFMKHAEPRSAFLLGRVSSEGFWYFFPVTFLLKTPVPLLALLAIAVATRRRHPGPWRDELFLWLPVGIYAAVAVARALNIGHRHLLPIYPFLFVAAGRAAAWAFPAPPARARVPALVVSALCGWHLVSTALIHPHYLAYVNELGGGPSNGYRLLADSSLDWGQDLKNLKAYIDRRGIQRIKLSYFGSADPAYYAIPGELLPSHMLPPPQETTQEVRPGELLAVSATNLQGVYLPPEDQPLMARLRAQKPIDNVGYTILIYRAEFAWPPR
jgi:4-amino-4-deoxy-L-arabinose transferase-like glycosyltransferase